MKLKSMFKVILVVVLAFSAIAPTAFAKAVDQDQLDRIYGPEGGKSVIVDHPQVHTPHKDSLELLAANVFIWSATYEIERHLQLSKDIILGEGYNAVWFESRSQTNTGTNTDYQVRLEAFSDWAGNGQPEATANCTVGNFSAQWFQNLSSTERYRIRVLGNVKGSIDVYKNSF